MTLPRKFILAIVTALSILTLNTAEAAGGAKASPPCLGAVCLGQSLQKLREMQWVESEGSLIFESDHSSEFPSYHPIGRFGDMDPFNRSLDALTTGSHGRLFCERRLLAEIKSDSDLSALSTGLRCNGALNVAMVGARALRELADSRPVFCEFMEFVSHFRSKSGHPTTVVFMTVALPSGEHDLVVKHVGRRLAMASEAGPAFEGALRRAYPDLITTRELRLECGRFGCGPAIWGRSSNPTKATAIEAAMLAGRDYIIYLEPPVLGYADLIFERSSPDWQHIFQHSLRQDVPVGRVLTRDDSDSLADNPKCVKPKAAVPPLE